MSAVDCANDSSSREPLITPLTDPGAGERARGQGNPSPAVPHPCQNVLQAPADGSVVAAHSAPCCPKR